MLDRVGIKIGSQEKSFVVTLYVRYLETYVFEKKRHIESYSVLNVIFFLDKEAQSKVDAHQDVSGESET